MAKRRKASRRKRPHQSSLTDVEWAIMNAVWDHEPCAAGTVQEVLQETHNWAYSTVKTLLTRLVDKGVLAEHKERNASVYEPLLSETKARRSALRALLDNAFDGTFAPLLQFLAEDHQLGARDRAALARLLEAEDADTTAGESPQ